MSVGQKLNGSKAPQVKSPMDKSPIGEKSHTLD